MGVFLVLLIAVFTPYLIYSVLILKFGVLAERRGPDRDVRDGPGSGRPGFSIVIPTYNEEELIGKKLDDTLALDYPRELLEIVIVDSSTDSTPEIVGGYQERYPFIKLIREKERGGLAVALNTAYRAASLDIVVKTDCDSFLDRKALFYAALSFADPGVGAVTGRQAVLNEAKVEEGYRSLQHWVQVAESNLDSTIIFHGPFSAYRRGLVVPIDPESLADDSELAVKVRKQGYRAIYNPEIRFYEASQSSFFKRRLQKDRRGRGLIRLLLQHRDVLFNPKYGRYGLVVFPANYFMMIVSPYLFLALLLAGLWEFYPLSLGLLVFLVVFVYLGQANRLYMLEPLYSFLDAQISLLLGGLSLLRGGQQGGTWEVDQELRDVYR